MLYPKRTKYRKYQKGRRNWAAHSLQVDRCVPIPAFGKFAIKSISSGRISYQTIEAARRAISRKFRRTGQIWVRVFADIPITRKPTLVRMGKGKGAPTGWMARVGVGQILFEMDGVNEANARQAAMLASQKLNIPTKFIQWSI